MVDCADRALVTRRNTATRVGPAAIQFVSWTYVIISVTRVPRAVSKSSPGQRAGGLQDDILTGILYHQSRL